jgi:hypothetical protein
MASYVPFSDNLSIPSEWGITAWAALLTLVPMLSALVVVRTKSHTKKRLGLAVVAALAVAAFFDYASTYRFTTHSSGAIVVTGSVMLFFLSLCWLPQPPTFSFRTSSKLQHHQPTVTLRFALRAFHCLVVLATHRSGKGADLILLLVL